MDRHVNTWPWVIALALGGCGGFGGANCPDADGDGTCDADESCEADADGDGICNTDDVCPLGDDRLDGDEDGVADACDPCPNLEGGDADGDGACDVNDPCPDDAEDDCDENVFFALQVDGFPDEASWSLLDPDNGTLDSGSFSSAGGGYTRRVALPAKGLNCLTLRDEEGNGGIRGRVFSRRRGRVFAEWDFYDWTTKSESFCFSLSDQGESREDLPVEQAFLDEARMCEVTIRFTTGTYADEHAWVLRLEDGDRLAGFGGKWATDPQYTADDANTVDQLLVKLPPGRYEVEMIDRFGDGWTEQVQFPDDAEIEISIEGEREMNRINETLEEPYCNGAAPCTRSFPLTIAGCG